MSVFHDYAAKKTELERDAFKEEQKEKGMPDVQEWQGVYDEAQLVDHYREREQESFQSCTRYYFTDSGVAEAKVKRYQNLAQDPDGEVESFAERFTNRDADKRKSKALAASEAFQTMQKKMKQYQNDNSDSYTRYLHREEIMKYRKEGMVKAAVVKGRNSSHERYLCERAELSCSMLLRDQLMHFLAEEKNQALRKKLMSKRKTIEKRIEQSRKNLKVMVGNVQETWLISNGVNDENVKTQYQLDHAKDKSIKKKDAKMHVLLNRLRSWTKDTEWPLRSVAKDEKQAPLSKAELNKQEEAKRYREAMERGDKKTLMEIEVNQLKWIERYPLPTAEEINKEGPAALFEKDFLNLYELTKKALPYYRKKLKNQEEPDAVASYIRNRPYLLAKLNVLVAFEHFLDYDLKAKHHLVIEADGKVTLDQSGEGFDEVKEQKLLNRYVNREKVLGSHKPGELIRKEEEEKEQNGLEEQNAQQDIVLDLETEKDQRAEFKRLSRGRKNYTKKNYKYYKFMVGVNGVMDCPQYLDLFNEGLDVYKSTRGLSGTYTRDALACMRYVKFDKKWQPVSEEDRANHEWNLKWLNAWKEDDYKTREEMIREQMPKALDNLFLPDITEEDLQSEEAFQAKLEKWADDIVKKGDEKSVFIMRAVGLAANSLMSQHPSFKKFMENNHVYRTLSDFLDPLVNYLVYSGPIKHQVDTSGSIFFLPKTNADNFVKVAETNQQASVGSTLERYKDYLAEKKKAQDEQKDYFPPMELTEEQKNSVALRKEKRRKEAEEKKRKEAELAQYKKDFAPYEKSHPDLNVERFAKLQRTANYDQTLHFSEYEAILKTQEDQELQRMDGIASFGLMPVEFDPEGKILPQSAEVHEANKLWLNTMITGSLEEKQEMVKKQAEELTKSFPLMERHNMDNSSFQRMFMREPLQTLRNLQKIRAYETLLQYRPELCNTLTEKVKEHMRGLTLLRPLVESELKERYGLDVSKPRLRYVNPSSAEEALENQKRWAASDNAKQVEDIYLRQNQKEKKSKAP